MRSSATYYPAGTATTCQESTGTLIVMIHAAAQSSKYTAYAVKCGVNTCCPLIKPHAKLLHQLPWTCTPWVATRLSSAAVAKASNASYSTIVRQGTSPSTRYQIPAGGRYLAPDLRKPFRERDSGIFFAEIWSDPGCIKVRFLRFGQIPGKKKFRSQRIKVGLMAVTTIRSMWRY